MPDFEKELKELQDRNLDIQRESSFQLWSNLIVVNGLLLTVMIGIAAFQTPDKIQTKFILSAIIVSLVVSSSALVWNIVMIKDVYRIAGEALNANHELDREKRDKDIRWALASNKRVQHIERFALVVLGLTMILLLGFIWQYIYS